MRFFKHFLMSLLIAVVLISSFFLMFYLITSGISWWYGGDVGVQILGSIFALIISIILLSIFTNIVSDIFNLR